MRDGEKCEMEIDEREMEKWREMRDREIWRWREMEGDERDGER